MGALAIQAAAKSSRRSDSKTARVASSMSPTGTSLGRPSPSNFNHSTSSQAPYRATFAGFQTSTVCPNRKSCALAGPNRTRFNKANNNSSLLHSKVRISRCSSKTNQPTSTITSTTQSATALPLRLPSMTLPPTLRATPRTTQRIHHRSTTRPPTSNCRSLAKGRRKTKESALRKTQSAALGLRRRQRTTGSGPIGMGRRSLRSAAMEMAILQTQPTTVLTMLGLTARPAALKS